MNFIKMLFMRCFSVSVPSVGHEKILVTVKNLF